MVDLHLMSYFWFLIFYPDFRVQRFSFTADDLKGVFTF